MVDRVFVVAVVFMINDLSHAGMTSGYPSLSLPTELSINVLVCNPATSTVLKPQTSCNVGK